MLKLEGIDFIYDDPKYHHVMIGYQGKLYGVKKSIDEILKILCEANGRDVNGSIELFKRKTDAHQKAAVLVDPMKEEFYFPTHAKDNSMCIWINYGRVKHVTSDDNERSIVVFKSGHMLYLDCSLKVIRRQIKRCQHLLDTLCNPYELICHDLM